MKKIWFIALLLTIVTTCLYGHDEGNKIYKTYCTGCHGAQLEGDSASSLIISELKYGRTRGSMIRNITYGIPNTEMSPDGALYVLLNGPDVILRVIPGQ